MFSDARSKKIILVSHCILNQNSISDGTADYPGTNESIMTILLQANVGIIQLPCPELLCLGLDRGDSHGFERPVVVENTRIRGELVKGNSIEIINKLVEQIIYQIEEYVQNGFYVLGIIGINRSPSCGINTTSINGQEVEGQGVFIETLRKALEKKNICLNMVGVKGSEMEKALTEIKKILR